jgi:hypothetical protein
MGDAVLMCDAELLCAGARELDDDLGESGIVGSFINGPRGHNN